MSQREPEGCSIAGGMFDAHVETDGHIWFWRLGNSIVIFEHSGCEISRVLCRPGLKNVVSIKVMEAVKVGKQVGGADTGRRPRGGQSSQRGRSKHFVRQVAVSRSSLLVIAKAAMELRLSGWAKDAQVGVGLIVFSSKVNFATICGED